LHQVIGRLPEREQLKATIERLIQTLTVLQNDLSSLAATIESAKAMQAQQQKAVEAARRAAEASGYDPELDDLLQSVRDLAVELGAARRIAAERRLECDRKRQAVVEETEKIERLKEKAKSTRSAAEKAQRDFEAAEETLHRADRLN